MTSKESAVVGGNDKSQKISIFTCLEENSRLKTIDVFFHSFHAAVK